MSLPRDVATDDGYFPEPYSLDPMPDEMRRGLIAPALMGTFSAISTFALIVFILHRMLSWRKHYRVFIGYNQYVMLVLNLLIGDLQQASAFLVSWYWIAKDKIVAPTAACFGQGWLLHSGDVSSGLFVLAIAVHTFTTAVLGKRISNPVFYSCIAALWCIAYILTGIGVALHPNDYFVRAGAWCWVNAKYETERLVLHYLWIFMIEFATVVMYAVTLLTLRRKANILAKNFEEDASAPNPKTIAAVSRVTRLMTLYPCVYILLTLPLSSGRMWSMAHDGALTSNAFSCTAGALLASCGWADALLYSLTRKKLLNETMPGRGAHPLGTIHTTEQIAITSHGRMRTDQPMQTFQDAHRRHVQFNRDLPDNERQNGCLIETPSPMEDSDSKTAQNIAAYDWGEEWSPQPTRRAQITANGRTQDLQTVRQKW